MRSKKTAHSKRPLSHVSLTFSEIFIKAWLRNDIFKIQIEVCIEFD